MVFSDADPWKTVPSSYEELTQSGKALSDIDDESELMYPMFSKMLGTTFDGVQSAFAGCDPGCGESLERVDRSRLPRALVTILLVE
jgi:hypothetical protein